MSSLLGFWLHVVPASTLQPAHHTLFEHMGGSSPLAANLLLLCPNLKSHTSYMCLWQTSILLALLMCTPHACPHLLGRLVLLYPSVHCSPC